MGYVKDPGSPRMGPYEMACLCINIDTSRKASKKWSRRCCLSPETSETSKLLVTELSWTCLHRVNNYRVVQLKSGKCSPVLMRLLGL